MRNKRSNIGGYQSEYSKMDGDAINFLFVECKRMENWLCHKNILCLVFYCKMYILYIVRYIRWSVFL